MALTYDQITAITEKVFLKKLADNVYNSNALIRRMTRPEKLMIKPGGERIVAPIINSEPGEGGSFSDLDVLSTTRTDNITAAEYLWKQYYEPIRVSRIEMLKNNGDQAKLDLVASKVQIAEKQIKENLADGLFSDGTGNGSKDITGLQATISTSSTYGGIAVADFSGWVATVKANGGTDRALSLNLMQQTFGACTQDEDRPTVLCMKQDVFDQAWALFQPHQRLMSEEMAGLGFKNVLTFNGVPMLVDSHMKANSIFFLNEEYVKLCVHKDENLRKETLERLESSNSMLMRIFWAGNLVCNNRRFQGELADIEVAS